MKKKQREKIIATLSKCENVADAAEFYNELIQIKPAFEKNSELQTLVTILNAIGNPDRLLILTELRAKDRCVCELEAILGKTQPAVSHHIRILEDAQLIRGMKQGRFTHYALIKDTFQKIENLWEEWTAKISVWFGIQP